ncbi:putative FAD-linked oxidoreductase [Pseudovibrio axinellae]|uniref:Putative FAD-linked oxidoreductase n=1 Tax=Pseudovibrio axinellae TaxID=989403 RepID=A0A161X8L4_9HYPH|nr:glycolate oxidase subunit GlcE [Pseudovibrio axinellae]KZL05481.1 putative FAD-linked oxidoreductase [Pseudovibrio axinellae]SEP97421.1 glycolate oxidase FAD binding subunit [Pseudovibrio axinellae]
MEETKGEGFHPGTAQELEAVIKWAAAERTPLEVIGHGSKRKWGRAVQSAHTLRVSGITGIIDYDPAELVLTVKAGTPLQEVNELLKQHNQELPFEPADLSAVLGTTPSQSGTIGGVLATNLSGPRRLKAGAARDHVLGLEAVSGRGEIFKAGGRVVKNVTGYDLSRGFCSSWGTLAVATSFSLKVLPRAAKECTLVLWGLTAQEASGAMSEAMGSSAEVSSAAHLPQGIGSLAHHNSATLLRLEGIAVSIDYRLEKLRRILARFTSQDVLDKQNSKNIWVNLRDLSPFVGAKNPLWKVSVSPTAGHKVIAELEKRFAIRWMADWAGGLIWIEMQGNEPHDVPLRRIIADNGGGHATLLRASAELRASIDVFQQQPEALRGITRRLKAQFDPHSVLNPGRMYASI